MNSIAKALDAYQAGHLEQSLSLLGGPQPDDEYTEAQTRAGWPAQTLVDRWVYIAQCRIRRELGEEIVAPVPVGLSLRTALVILGDEARRDEGVQWWAREQAGPGAEPP
jgi:hypothetical protein